MPTSQHTDDRQFEVHLYGSQDELGRDAMSPAGRWTAIDWHAVCVGTHR